MFEVNENFQTPPVVADHMTLMAQIIKNNDIHLIARKCNVLEPTPGKGNLVTALERGHFIVYHPVADFWDMLFNQEGYFDFVIMNPPFNPVKEMERFVNRAMELSDNVIALLPWTYIINSERRLLELSNYGLVSVTHLPRKTFPGCRVQVAIFELKKGYAGKTEFKRFTW